jgi:hypothetical protein
MKANKLNSKSTAKTNQWFESTIGKKSCAKIFNNRGRYKKIHVTEDKKYAKTDPKVIISYPILFKTKVSSSASFSCT